MYDASVSLLVVPDIRLVPGAPTAWILPPHYITSALLPLSSELSGQRDGTKKGTMTYSLLSITREKDEIKQGIILEGDRIRTTESNSLACIQAKDRISGKTDIACCIRVAEVAQVRMTKEFPFHAVYLSVGAELDLPVTYFDTLGIPFHEAHYVVPYQVETNHHDILSLGDIKQGNMNINLKALQPGRALVRVSLTSNQKKSDYVLISVGAHLYPQNPVIHAGGSLSFSVQGINDWDIGRWDSFNKSVVSVDAFGKAEAVGVGSTQVIFECPTMKVQTEVTVLPGNVFSVVPPKEMLTNVPYPTKGYSFPVELSDAQKMSVTGGNGKVLVDCKVFPSFVGYAKPLVDSDSGNLYCIFFPYSPEHLARSMPKSKDIRRHISLSINVSLGETDHVLGSASALFVGGFSIPEMRRGFMQLNLTPDSSQTTITILGNTDIDIYWQKKEAIVINLVDKEDFGVGSTATYEVKVFGPNRVKDRVRVSLPSNGQEMVIDVNYEPAAAKPVASSFLVKILVAVMVLAITCVTVALRSQRTASPLSLSPSPSPSLSGNGNGNDAGPGTPDHNSSPGFTERSPRTPQPYMEYVRRTIDETPFYKRDARRRFNPQNTY